MEAAARQVVIGVPPDLGFGGVPCAVFENIV
jgi:hypothetical protein